MSGDTIKKVGILRGMAGVHYESSLKGGGDIISHISEKLKDRWQPVDIFIDKNYIWHHRGVPINPGDLPHKVDLVWNASHPSLSNILESLSIPNIGTPGFSFLLEKNRDMLGEHVKKMKLKMPRHLVIPLYQKDFSAGGGDESLQEYAFRKAQEIFQKFGAPWVVKFFIPDSGMEAHTAKTFLELADSIEDGAAHQINISVEEFIEGKIASAHSVSAFRGEDIYVFSPINFTVGEKEKLTALVKDLHDHIGARHYLKSDFILHPRGGFFLTGIDFSSDLRKGSHFEQSCEAVGAKMHQVVEHMLDNVLGR